MKAQMYHYAEGVSIPPLRVLLGEEAWKGGLSPGRILMLFWKPATHHSNSSSTSKHPRPESGQFGVIQPSLSSRPGSASTLLCDLKQVTPFPKLRFPHSQMKEVEPDDF